MRVGGQHTDCKGVWIHGLSDIGKSSLARDLLALDVVFIKPRDKWFDGYQNEKAILYEDIGKFDVKLGTDIKLWLDRFHGVGETKGGVIALKHERMIFTSQYCIERIWDDEETIVAVTRRCIIYHITVPYHTPLKKNPDATPEERY
jgi:hypothetical protein